MKKYIAVAVITGLISGAAFAQTVASANVLGYNRITVPSNQYVLVALDFNTTNNTVTGLFPNLPTLTEVSFWNSTAQTWTTIQKSRAGWGAGGTNRLVIGSGAFLKLPAVPGTNVYMSGDVPLNGTTTLYTANGYKLLSYPYPVNIAFTNTALAKGAATLDEVSVWKNNTWVTYQKSRAGWPSTITNVQLQIGQAVIFKTTATRTNNEVKPYTIN